MQRIAVHSCDIYFYEVGRRLGIDRIAEWSRRFGLGAPTGLDLDKEMPGLVAFLGLEKGSLPSALARRRYHLGIHRPGLQSDHSHPDGPGGGGHCQRRHRL